MDYKLQVILVSVGAVVIIIGGLLALFARFFHKVEQGKVIVRNGVGGPTVSFGGMFVVSGIGNSILLCVTGIAYNLGVGLINGATTVMISNAVDYGEYKLGKRSESIIFSAQTLLVKLASALSGWLIGVGLSLIGYVAGAAVQSNITIIGIRVIMTIIPSIVALVMYVIYKSKYKINGSFHDEILQVIGSRKKVKVLNINNK